MPLIPGFDVMVHDYNRRATGILICSGFGLGLSIMDMCLKLGYLLDIDNYRHEVIDWEAIGVIVAVRYYPIVLAGWYTIDTPTTMQKLKKGLINGYLEYVGGSGDLGVFINSVASV